MKSKLSLVISLILFCFISYQCTKEPEVTYVNGGTSISLKSALNSSAQNLNEAVNAIYNSKGYQLLSINNTSSEMTASVQSGYTDSINLAAIAGIYSYSPSSYINWCYACYNRLFIKTDTSHQLIIEMPSVKVFQPNRFQSVIPADTSLKNNFIISASNFHFYYSNNWIYDYDLAANLAINDTSIGSIGIQSTGNSQNGYNYNSNYSFADGYTISIGVKSGDTASSSLTLTGNDTSLLSETVIDVATSGSRYREFKYILQIGNVELIRTSGSDSITVYENGVLQNNAKVSFADQSSDGVNSMFFGQHRNITITFDDGTTTSLSTLLSPSMTILQTLVSSLQQDYFATNLVNYIAMNIYNNKISK